MDKTMSKNFWSPKMNYGLWELYLEFSPTIYILRYKPPFLRLYSKTHLKRWPSTDNTEVSSFQSPESQMGRLGTQIQIQTHEENICSSYIEPSVLDSINLARSDDWATSGNNIIHWHTLSEFEVSKGINGSRKDAGSHVFKNTRVGKTLLLLFSH